MKKTNTEQGKNKVDSAGEHNGAKWDRWNNYEKITIDGQTYAKVGDKLYSKHAVDRMQPSGNRFGPSIYQAGGDYGRSIAPNYVDDVINSSTPIYQPETGNYVHSSGTVQVITNSEGAIVTIMTYR